MPFHPGLQGNGGDDGLDFKFAKGKEGKKMSDFKMLPFKDASLGSQALTDSHLVSWDHFRGQP